MQHLCFQNNYIRLMNFIRKNILFKIFTFVFALHILNMSVNAPDYVPVNLAVNEMESITEIICEQILHIENAFPEQSRQNNPDHGAPCAADFSLMFYHQPMVSLIPVAESHFLFVNYSENFFSQHACDILTPPPKA